MGWTPRTVVTATASSGVQGSASAYLFAAQGTRHAVVRAWAPDEHSGATRYTEYWESRNGAAGTTDSMAGTDAPPGFGEPWAYVFDHEGTQHLVYQEFAATGHLHELWWTDGDRGHTALADAVDGYAAASGRATGYAFSPSFENSQHVVYRGVDSHVHELTREQERWRTFDLTLTEGARPAAGRPAGFAADAAGTQHVAVRATVTGEVDVLSWDHGWTSATVNTQPGTAGAVGDVTGYAFASEGTLHVDYADADGHVWEIWRDGTGWHPSDLTVAAGVPAASFHATGSELTAWVQEAGLGGPTPSQHVVYAGVDAHVHELRWTAAGGWTWTDLTTRWGAPAVAIDPVTATPSGFADPATGTQHLFYVTPAHELVELTWTRDDTRVSATAVEASGADLSGVFRA